MSNGQNINNFSADNPAGSLFCDSLNILAELIANVTSAYSCVIFWADHEKTLHIKASCTQSQEFLHTSQISFGTGLVGWVAENQTKLSVSPFEHDARSLLYYSANQELESFIAMPILDDGKELLGVLVCDSQREDAFDKNTENTLNSFIKQIIALHQMDARFTALIPQKQSNPDVMMEFIEGLRHQRKEEDLFEFACRLPKEIAAYEALVVVSTAERGVGIGGAYSMSNNEQLNHKLLESICRHKKVLCSQKNVRILSQNDKDSQMAFLSIPFHALDKEVGSLNLTAPRGEEFSEDEIASLETIARVMGQVLENIRLKERLIGHNNFPTLSWKIFFAQTELLLQQRLKTKQRLSLMRVEFNNLDHIEAEFGIVQTLSLLEKAARLAEQIKRQSSVICRIYESKLYVLTETSEVPSFANRFCKMIEKLYLTDKTNAVTKLQCDMLLNGLSILSATAPEDGNSLEELISKIHSLSNELTVYRKEAQGNAR